MDSVRTALLVVICVLAIAGTALFFGADRPPLTPDERVIAGRWSGDAVDPRSVGGPPPVALPLLARSARSVDLELGDTGHYALVAGTGGGVECGKWRVEGGSLQMRAKRGASAGSTLLMTQPGLRAGTFVRDGDRMDVSLQTALPGARSRPESWTLRKTQGALLARCR